jgi:hypothetical protein
MWRRICTSQQAKLKIIADWKNSLVHLKAFGDFQEILEWMTSALIWHNRRK